MKKFLCAVVMLMLVFSFPAQAKVQPLGSAGLLSEPHLLISIYIQTEECEWDRTAMVYTRYALSQAVDYVEGIGDQCGKEIRLITALDDPDLEFTMTYNTAMHDSAESSGYRFSQTVHAFIQDNIPQEELLRRHNAAGIGYLFLLPGEGCAYAMPFYLGDSMEWFYEYAVLYAYDIFAPGIYESPSAYAHEILHLFGAPDLYIPYRPDGVTHDLVQFVDSLMYQELMYDTYEPNGDIRLHGISQYVSEITLYCLGLIDDTVFLDLFPSLRREYPGAFGASIQPGSWREYDCMQDGCWVCDYD